ncbi:MAG: peptide deformylase [Rhodothermales bacterium]|nr:peptide deformylase [Rhodothermales bacterium]
MILPIHIYGDPILRTETDDVAADSPELQQLIDDMIETMHGAAGIGLAAPQVGRTERLFVVDLRPLYEDLTPEEIAALPPQPMAFINPEIVWESDEDCAFEEGCLSIPDLREDVVRPERITIEYLDRHFERHEMEVGSLLARVIQHEYDHLDGILFIDHISAFRRGLLKRRLREMARGQVEADYPLALDPAA